MHAHPLHVFLPTIPSVLVALPLLLASFGTHGAGNTAAPCSADAYRQFDFWLGEWQVYGGPASDKLIGRSSISRVAAGCALNEHWINNAGQDGRSLNVFEPATGRWTQFWVGSDGVVLRLHGGIDKGNMVLQGELAGANGGVQKQRIRWTPQADGSVEQRWETSDDDGKSWQTSFVGRYRRSP